MADIQEGTRLLLKYQQGKCVVAINHEGEVLPLMHFPADTPLEEMYAAIAESISANKKEVSNELLR